jgi:hypothetical protein
MFTLRFFAGPIVDKINPVGLLFASAALGTIGLYMLGNEAVDSVWPWMAAVTIYGIGKTFYWPTLLGVISERFPKGGALALGLAGGAGMIGAGILGAPGIGYKQDYFAVQYLERSDEGMATYQRYVARNAEGKPETTNFPFITALFPQQVPPVAGIDNAKLKVFEDWKAIEAKRTAAKDEGKTSPEVILSGVGGLNVYIDEVDRAKAEGKEPPNVLLTTLQADIVTLLRAQRAGRPVEPKLEEELTKRLAWWDKEGRPHFEEDKPLLSGARLYGAKTALLYTAFVPLGLAIGFLILIAYFYFTGGYKQVHLEDKHPPMEE